MPLDITFTLSDRDLEHFQAIVDKARDTVKDLDSASHICDAARKLVAEAQSGELPDFIGERIARLGWAVDMVNDEEWKLSDDERRTVLSALAYFVDPEDLIPDHIPGLGFLDDAIYAEIVLRELAGEIQCFREFCEFREAEEARRAARGEDTRVGREAWLAEKRASLHARMRGKRGMGDRRGAWGIRLW
jgi:uncharacterized membrane protein YkvA (DUF1232 family)